MAVNNVGGSSANQEVQKKNKKAAEKKQETAQNETPVFDINRDGKVNKKDKNLAKNIADANNDGIITSFDRKAHLEVKDKALDKRIEKATTFEEYQRLNNQKAKTKSELNFLSLTDQNKDKKIDGADILISQGIKDKNKDGKITREDKFITEGIKDLNKDGKINLQDKLKSEGITDKDKDGKLTHKDRLLSLGVTDLNKDGKLDHVDRFLLRKGDIDKDGKITFKDKATYEGKTIEPDANKLLNADYSKKLETGVNGLKASFNTIANQEVKGQLSQGIDQVFAQYKAGIADGNPDNDAACTAQFQAQLAEITKNAEGLIREQTGDTSFSLTSKLRNVNILSEQKILKDQLNDVSSQYAAALADGNPDNDAAAAAQFNAQKAEIFGILKPLEDERKNLPR